MKRTSGPLYEAIKKDYVVYATPKLIFDWNYNRFAGTQTVDNTPSEENQGYDPDKFPIDSIVEPLRPYHGIIKARVGEGRVSFNYLDKPNADRYYIASDEDRYKYWTSPYPSNKTGSYNMPLHTDGITTARPRVIYSRDVQANKIVIGFEDTWSHADNYEIFLMYTSGDTWHSIGSNFSIDSNGQVELYYNGTNWTTTLNRSSQRTVRGIQLRVYSMDKPDAYFNLIEMGVHLENRLDKYLISCNDTFDLGEASLVTPIGQANSNIGTLSMFNALVDEDNPNLGLVFNNQNANSPYYQLIDKNINVTLSYEFTLEGGLVPGSGLVPGGVAPSSTLVPGGITTEDATDAVQAFEMLVENWNDQTSGEVQVDLRDRSGPLQEVKPRKMFYRDLTVPEIVWRICDSVGFNKYNIDLRDDDPSTTIPEFWVDGKETVWEIFSGLSQETQCAIYFDNHGVLQIKTRRAAFNEAKTTPDWTFRSEDTTGQLADIVDIAQPTNYEANTVKVNYQTTKFSELRNGFPKQEVVWEPEGTVVLRSADLQRTLDPSDGALYLNPKDAKIWPYSGMIEIQGELIRYDGKQYVYYEDGVRKTRVMNTDAERRRFHDKTPAAQQHKNGWNGALHITDRGVWNSENKRHSVEVEGYNIHSIKNGVRTVGVSGFRHNRTDSTVTLTTHDKWDSGDWLLATRGNPADFGFHYMGTKLKFEKDSRSHQMAGLVFNNNGGNEAGYFIELRPTRFFDGPVRKDHNEVTFYVRRDDGTVKRLGGHIQKVHDASKTERKNDENKVVDTGVPWFIREDKWIEVDVSFLIDGSDHFVTIYIDGVAIFSTKISGANKTSFGGKFGVYARGDTKASFEYLYGISRDEGPRPDDLSFFDRVESGYIGNQMYKEWVWRDREVDRPHAASDKARVKYSQMFMDEFGPIVHEVRNFDIRFDPNPVLSSKLYVSNDSQVLCPRYRSDAFGAQFTLVNASRHNAIVSGEDTLQFGADNSVDQQFMIFGRTLIIRDVETVTARNESQIRKRGVIETEISSPWIQDKDEAQSLADWIEGHWSNGQEQVILTVFGNPLVEIGDVVAIDYPEKEFHANQNMYFVVGTSTDFSAGLETQLTLRRLKLT